MYVCSVCESPDIAYDALVSVNTDEIVTAFESLWCPECDGETSMKEA